MIVIFCSNPLNHREVDPDFSYEYSCALVSGFEVCLIDYESFIGGDDLGKAIRRIQDKGILVTGIYRGWMLKPAQYEALYNLLLHKNIQLVNSPEAYRICHYLPASYPYIKDFTPKTLWLKFDSLGYSEQEIDELLVSFGTSPVIVKDYVKSRKHEWFEACYIPDASDSLHAQRVIRKFLELQGEDLNEGIVLRQYVDLEPLARHSKSGMPLTKEFRIFFYNGSPIKVYDYWNEGDYGGVKPDISGFMNIAGNIPSAFFTMDIAKITNNGWTIIELGDGQVSGLPDETDAASFYTALKDAVMITAPHTA